MGRSSMRRSKLAVVWMRKHYGAGPFHLLALLASLFLGGYVVMKMDHVPGGLRVLVWFAGAIIGHDIVLFPLYAIADRSLVTAAGIRRSPPRANQVPWINHVRGPAIVSAMLLAVSFPLVFRLAEPTYHAATGLTDKPYLSRWLLASGIAFLVSAVLYALRVGKARRAAP